MKKLKEQLYDILYIHEMPAPEHLNRALDEILQAVKEHDACVIGEDEKIMEGGLLKEQRVIRNNLRTNQRKHAEESL